MLYEQIKAQSIFVYNYLENYPTKGEFWLSYKAVAYSGIAEDVETKPLDETGGEWQRRPYYQYEERQTTKQTQRKTKIVSRSLS